ncbi:MAG TPA: aspartyl/asparaginyl beta-hydroxylase domain-containing protein [Vicinamibacterales bacterium]|jgi:mannose-6-phosphate isomerase-like protein (cupin superfamily)|nr:aspartyl/asparaginyl beta-hydroxylase domain-containing protein [Vicinamibacterales bacterium]
MSIIRWARLPLAIDLPSLQADVARLPDEWMPHFQKAHYEGDWTMLALRSIDGRVDQGLPFALDGRGGPAQYLDTPLLAECPAIAQFIASLACPVMSARLLNLRRGATIRAHRDADLAFESGEARLHLPIVTNPGVEFFVEDERVVMDAGSCWYINANLTHRVANHGDADRIHLVVDCAVDGWLRERFAGAAVSYSAKTRRDPEELRQIVALLRAMDTPAARALVVQLEDEIGTPAHGV